MPLHILKREQKVPVSIEKAWDFLSAPENLNLITPEYLNFDIKSDIKNVKMYAGMIIYYKVRPVLNIPVEWVSEITHVNEPFYFIDEQRFGPYKFWHHKHFLKEIEGGTLMTDIVHYKVGYWIFDRLMNSLMVRKKLNEIFDYRYKKIQEIFGKFNN